MRLLPSLQPLERRPRLHHVDEQDLAVAAFFNAVAFFETTVGLFGARRPERVLANILSGDCTNGRHAGAPGQPVLTQRALLVRPTHGWWAGAGLAFGSAAVPDLAHLPAEPVVAGYPGRASGTDRPVPTRGFQARL